MIWVRRVVPMLLGAGLLYAIWRLVAANGAPVDLDFVVVQLEGIALWKLLGAFLLVGASSVGCLLVLQVVRGRLTVRRYQRRLSVLETEVHQLRNLPLAPAEPPGEEGHPAGLSLR